MNSKQQILAGLRAAFEDWEKLLASSTEEEITAHRRPDAWSVADVVAHMMAWQQLSNARLEAALQQTDPTYPEWLGGADPFFADDHVKDFNARIHDRYAGRPWPEVHRAWREGFQRLLEQGEAVPESDLLERDRYPWLRGAPLAAVLEGSRDHHREHYQRVSEPPA